MFPKLITRALVLLIMLAAAWTSLGTASAASIEQFTSDCHAIHLTGHTTVSTNTIRITITLASNLMQQLSASVVRVAPGLGAAFSADVPYPPQEPGTRLIVAVGEWDGAKYLVPAETLGFDVPACAAAPTAVATAAATAVATASADWRTYGDSRLGFSFDYPPAWVTRVNSARQNIVEFVLPPNNLAVLQVAVHSDGDKPMDYYCTHKLCLYDRSQIDQIFSLRLGRMVTIPGSPQNAAFIRREDMMVNGERGAVIDLWTVGAEQNKTRFVFVRTAGRLYGISGDYQTEAALADWMEVISSFRWLKQ